MCWYYYVFQSPCTCRGHAVRRWTDEPSLFFNQLVVTETRVWSGTRMTNRKICRGAPEEEAAKEWTIVSVFAYTSQTVLVDAKGKNCVPTSQEGATVKPLIWRCIFHGLLRMHNWWNVWLYWRNGWWYSWIPVLSVWMSSRMYVLGHNISYFVIFLVTHW
jgi:hypothetical protein